MTVRFPGSEHAHTAAAVEAAVAAVRTHTPLVPEVALILGTGLGALGRAIALECERRACFC